MLIPNGWVATGENDVLVLHVLMYPAPALEPAGPSMVSVLNAPSGLMDTLVGTRPPRMSSRQPVTQDCVEGGLGCCFIFDVSKIEL